MNDTAKVTFTKFEGTPGEIRQCDILLGGELVGEVTVDWKDSTPGAMSHKYVVANYTVELYDIEDSQKFFDVGAAGAKAALKAAKEYAISLLAR